MPAAGTIQTTDALILRMSVRNKPVRTISLIFAMFVGLAAGAALAQSVGADRVPEQAVTCPPDVKGEGPTAGVDRDIHVTPPGGGELKIIPPPGTPGGDPRVEPK